MANGPEPDFEDNPPGLDTPEEVKMSLDEDGLDPMDVDSVEEATFGHSLVHAFADDPDHGGRTEVQLEAEHDMTVEAMIEFGVEHDSPLDLEDID